MMPSYPPRQAVLRWACYAMAAICLVAADCNAQSQWLTPGLGAWHDPVNWSAGVPDAPGATALFSAAAAPHVDVVIDEIPAVLSGMQFAGPGSVTLLGTQPLVLVGSPETPIPFIDVAFTAANTDLAVNLQSLDGLEKTGGGDLTLSGGGQAGAVHVEQGGLAIGPDAALNAALPSTIGPGGRLRLDQGAFSAPQLFVDQGGMLIGSGMVSGDTLIGTSDPTAPPAVMSPGLSPGELHVQGDLSFEAGAELIIEISGAPDNPHDLVTVDGDAALGGVLELHAIDGYTPQVGDRFTVFMSNAFADEDRFDDVRADRVGDVLLWPVYNSVAAGFPPDAGGAAAAGAPCVSIDVIGLRAGDMDLSGVVDLDDVSQFAFALRDNLAYDNALFATEYEVADIDGNGRVDFGDIAPFVERVEQSGSATASQVLQVLHAYLAVPEPSAWGLFAFVAILANAGRSAPGPPLRRRSHTPGFTLIELLVVIAIVSVLLGILLPAVQSAREAARQTQCSNNLRQLGIALLGYEEQQRSFPIGAKAHRQEQAVSIGWQVEILPFLEQRELYERIQPDQEGGAFDHNLASELPPNFFCPTSAPPIYDPQVKQSTNYVGVAGANATRDGDNAEMRLDLEDRLCGDVFLNGMLTYRDATPMSRATDGASRTLLVGERVYMRGIDPWTFGAKWDGQPPERICIGSIKNLRYPPNADLHNVGAYVRDMEFPVEERRMVRNDLLLGSEHPHGVFFAYADASVHFSDDSADFTILQDLATR